MFSLIPLTTEDGGILAKIHASCFSDAWDKATFDRLLTESLTCGWVATRVEAHPVGFILARVVKGEAEILTLAVQPSSQKLGVGHCLLRGLINFLASVECGKIFLEVAVDNERAIALYASKGFVIVGKRPNYYQRGDQTFVPAYTMAWTKDDVG